MAFIETIAAADSDAETRAMYEHQQAHYGYLPNYAKVFCYRPEVMALWAELQRGIRRHMDKRRFELVTFAAAHELRSTLCSLAHGRKLGELLSNEDVIAIAKGESPQSLSAAEAAMVTFARKVARDASAVTAHDVDRLKQQGVSDAEIFDIAATAAGRAFFSKIIESLGVEVDAPLPTMDGNLKNALTAGRPIDFAGDRGTGRAQ